MCRARVSCTSITLVTRACRSDKSRWSPGMCEGQLELGCKLHMCPQRDQHNELREKQPITLRFHVYPPCVLWPDHLVCLCFAYMLLLGVFLDRVCRLAISQTILCASFISNHAHRHSDDELKLFCSVCFATWSVNTAARKTCQLASNRDITSVEKLTQKFDFKNRMFEVPWIYSSLSIFTISWVHRLGGLIDLEEWEAERKYFFDPSFFSSFRFYRYASRAREKFFFMWEMHRRCSLSFGGRNEKLHRVWMAFRFHENTAFQFKLTNKMLLIKEKTEQTRSR